ncbi:hypothetical protein POM88_024455 [Heracleum sosnowskyi]|uniref:F-box domain-containing protein n=1 Tax=Heracleum sosnowskyi TaxID=360622 RepID=A0AAD8I346_9APIA|nr:hypothetical protein POM88_024455 [Heracleum sosnowskyi]
MSSSQCSPLNNKLTDDLLTKILVRLPVKSLLCCKAVSKPWCSLISSPRFIISHLGYAITRPGADETLIVQDFDGVFEPNNTISLLNLRAAQPQSTLNSPFSEQGQFRTKLVGCCRGLVCVSVAKYDCNLFSSKTYDERRPVTYLWNPATKQFKRLPPHIVHYDTLNEVVQGFGYDPVDDDFKIVRVVSYPVKVEVEEDVDEVQEADAEVRVDVEVYSAKLNVWRKLEQDCMPQEIIEFQTSNYDICVNGILCCNAKGFSGILAFDLNQEVFNCDVEFPVSDQLYSVISINDSTIGLITVEEFGGEFNLWKLDDVECLRGGSGLEPSWSLKLGIKVGFGCMPLSYYNSGDLVLLIDGPVWVWYNPDKKEAIKLPIKRYWRQIFRYTPSLVSIPGFKQVKWNALESESESEDESESGDEVQDEDDIESGDEDQDDQ